MSLKPRWYGSLQAPSGLDRFLDPADRRPLPTDGYRRRSKEDLHWDRFRRSKPPRGGEEQDVLEANHQLSSSSTSSTSSSGSIPSFLVTRAKEVNFLSERSMRRVRLRTLSTSSSSEASPAGIFPPSLYRELCKTAETLPKLETTYLVVSHDRTFLDAVATKVAHLDRG